MSISFSEIVPILKPMFNCWQNLLVSITTTPYSIIYVSVILSLDHQFPNFLHPGLLSAITVSLQSTIHVYHYAPNWNNCQLYASITQLPCAIASSLLLIGSPKKRKVSEWQVAFHYIKYIPLSSLEVASVLYVVFLPFKITGCECSREWFPHGFFSFLELLVSCCKILKSRCFACTGFNGSENGLCNSAINSLIKKSKKHE